MKIQNMSLEELNNAKNKINKRIEILKHKSKINIENLKPENLIPDIFLKKFSRCY